tara:strand:+ start:286 stop:501 length:216 start_codon:yes stop_codon:yes gene_type:complete
MNEKVLKLLGEVLEKNIKLNDSADNVSNWDSLNHLRIILEIENEFDISIEHEIIPDLNSVKKILDYLNAKL